MPTLNKRSWFLTIDKATSTIPSELTYVSLLFINSRKAVLLCWNKFLIMTYHLTFYRVFHRIWDLQSIDKLMDQPPTGAIRNFSINFSVSFSWTFCAEEYCCMSSWINIQDYVVTSALHAASPTRSTSAADDCDYTPAKYVPDCWHPIVF